MIKRKTSVNVVVALAYFHLYGWIATMMVLVMIMPKLILYTLGICYILFSLWTFIGYKLKWLHIYCSLQKAHRKKMTPNSINWSQIKKSDIYGLSVVFLILGLMLLIINMMY